MPDTVADGDAGGGLVVPSDVGELAHVHVNDEAEEDKTDTMHHFAEQDRELAEIEGLRFVHGTLLVSCVRKMGLQPPTRAKRDAVRRFGVGNTQEI